MVKRRPSSKRWLQEHHDDPFVKEARVRGLRSRAALKLEQIQEKFALIGPGQTVVDLGAAPGGWSQMAAQLAGSAVGGSSGRVVAADLLDMAPLAGVEFIQGDFLDDAVYHRLCGLLPQGRAHVVLSDMAPNMTGIRAADQGRGEGLAEAAFHFAETTLAPGGALVIKLFQGPAFHELVGRARGLFATAKVFKPPASRDRSAETYLIGRDFRPSNEDESCD